MLQLSHAPIKMPYAVACAVTER